MRTTYWGHWSLDLIEGTTIRGRIYYAVGSQGPVSGARGTPLRHRYEAIAKAWIDEESP